MLPALPPARFPEAARALRAAIRNFLANEIAAGEFRPVTNGWTVFDAAFSRRLGQRGYIGMTWPAEYGGQGRSFLERFVVVEELLAHGAPVGAHWIADRQSGGQILRFGSAARKRELLPRIAAGECFFAIGMSEPDVGSDLASVRTRAERVEGGWRINGTKVWTTHGHRAHYMIALVRTAPPGQNRHDGLTQLIVDMSRPGVRTRGIENLGKHAEFCETVFEDYLAADADVLGEAGQGWQLVTHELAQERSGPERFMSDFPLLVALTERLSGQAEAPAELGRTIGRFLALREMSISVAETLTRGLSPDLSAALVKDLGTQFERDLPEAARLMVPWDGRAEAGEPYNTLLAQTVLSAPSFTLRGGTQEILRGIIAKGLGLR